MPTWLSIFLACGGSTLIGILVTNLVNWLKNTSKGAKERIKREKQKEMREVIQKEIEPLDIRMTKIEKNTSQSVLADVLVLRCNMKILHDRVVKQNYADIGDKATMRELYTRYYELGGNHFLEYVDQWLSDVEKLDDKKGE